MNKKSRICEYCDPHPIWRKSFINRAGVQVYIDYNDEKGRYYLGLKLKHGTGVNALLAKACPVCGRRLPNGQHIGSKEANT